METPEQRFDRVWAQCTEIVKAHVLNLVAQGVNMDRIMYNPKIQVFNTKEERDAAVANYYNVSLAV